MDLGQGEKVKVKLISTEPGGTGKECQGESQG